MGATRKIVARLIGGETHRAGAISEIRIAHVIRCGCASHQKEVERATAGVIAGKSHWPRRRMISKLPAEWLYSSRGVPRAALLLSLMMPVAVAAMEPASIAQGDNGLVGRALDNELAAAQDHSHPMQYRLRRSSPRLTTTKLIIETKDGAVARL